MVLFNSSDQTETLRQLMKAFLIGGFGKAIVHIRPLVVLALSGGEKVFGGVTNAVQFFEPELVLLFVFGGFQEHAAICSPSSWLWRQSCCSLGLTGKGGHQRSYFVSFMVDAFQFFCFHYIGIMIPFCNKVTLF